MNDNYMVSLQAPEGGWTPDHSTTLQNAINDHGLTHFKVAKTGEVHRLHGDLNAKSVPCGSATDDAKPRYKYSEVESFGVIAEPPEVGEQEPPAHTERAHALLSASGAHRWLNCTPSARLEERYPDTTSDAAAEGTAAHELAEHKLRSLMGLPTQEPTSQWHDEEMESHCDDYADHVMAELELAKLASPAAFLAIEQRLDFSHIVPEGFGTGDATIVGDGTMTIVDFKYGKGVEVSAQDNPQMRLYALGAIRAYGMIYDIQTVRMVIFQPRLGNISIDEIRVDDLLAWADTVVTPTAQKAIKGEGDLVAGEWCQFCRHAPQCPALAKYHLDPLPQDNAGAPAAPEPETLTDTQIAQIIEWSGDIKKWLSKVESYALDQANNGKTYPGLKLVEGRSVRRYADEDTVAKKVAAEGHDPYKPREVLGITAMTKLLGKKQFDAMLGDLVHKPAGKPTLVPESDKRQALTASTPDTVFQALNKETA